MFPGHTKLLFGKLNLRMHYLLRRLSFQLHNCMEEQSYTFNVLVVKFLKIFIIMYIFS